jgi:hypothetical protein
MNTNTTPSFEAKVAKVIYNNLAPIVANAAVHPIFCRLNLHNSRLLKKINHKARMVYGMGYQPDILVKASYERGGEDGIENALITIQELVRGEHHADHKEYIFKRLEYLATEAISALYDRNHQDWISKINTAIQNAKTNKVTKKIVKDVKVKTSVKVTKKKSTTRKRNKKGQFVSNPRKR